MRAESAPSSQAAVDLVGPQGEVVILADDALRGLDSFSFDVVARFASLEDGNLTSLSEQLDQDGFYLALHDRRLVLGFGTGGSVAQIASEPDLIKPGRWYRISMTKDKETAYLFVDGKMIAAGMVPIDIVDSKADLKLGDRGAIGRGARVQLSEFQFWAEPLLWDHVVALNRAQSRHEVPKPLIHYDFAEGRGTQLRNLAGNGYRAVIAALAEDAVPERQAVLHRAVAKAVQAVPEVDGQGRGQQAVLKLGADAGRLEIKDLSLADPRADLTLRMKLRPDAREPGVIASLVDEAGARLSVDHGRRTVWIDLKSGVRKVRLLAPVGTAAPDRWLTLTVQKRDSILRLLVDGQQVASYATPSDLTFRKLMLALGGRPRSAGVELAELGLWQRALSDQEAGAAFDAAAAPVDPDLLLRYGPWNEPEASSVISDRSGHGHDAALRGTGDSWAMVALPTSVVSSNAVAKSSDAVAKAVEVPGVGNTTSAGRGQAKTQDETKQPGARAKPPFDLPLGDGQLVALAQPAETLIVGDPNIAKAEIVTPRKIYLFGANLGRTKVTALDRQNQTIMVLPIQVTSNERAANEDLRKIEGGDDNRFVDVAGQLKLEGPAKDVGEASDLAAVSENNSIGGRPSRNATVIQGAQQVNIRVRFAEVSRSDIARLGINWSAVISPGEFVGGIVSGDLFLSGAASDASGAVFGALNRGDLDINFLLDALQREGALTLLAEPNLTVLNGEEARFLAGGELPIPVPQDDRGTIIVQFRPFGVSLNFRPILLDDNRISLHVQSEVSDISTAGAVQFADALIPAFNVRRAETTLEMASGQTFAVGGLFQRTTSRDIESFPGLASIPVLGALFRSTRYHRSETELVILITPYLVDPVAEQSAFVMPGQAPVSPDMTGQTKAPAMGFTFR